MRTSASCAGASSHVAHTALPSLHNDLAVSQRSPAGALSPETTARSPLYSTHTNTCLCFIIHIPIPINKDALTLIMLGLILGHSDHENTMQFKCNIYTMYLYSQLSAYVIFFNMLNSGFPQIYKCSM